MIRWAPSSAWMDRRRPRTYESGTSAPSTTRLVTNRRGRLVHVHHAEVARVSREDRGVGVVTSAEWVDTHRAAIHEHALGQRIEGGKVLQLGYPFADIAAKCGYGAMICHIARAKMAAEGTTTEAAAAQPRRSDRRWSSTKDEEAEGGSYSTSASAIAGRGVFALAAAFILHLLPAPSEHGFALEARTRRRHTGPDEDRRPS